MSYVAGNPITVRKLEDLLKSTLQQIEVQMDELNAALKTLHEAWNDPGVDEIDNVFQTITRAIEGSKESAPRVEKALIEYADYLDSLAK